MTHFSIFSIFQKINLVKQKIVRKKANSNDQYFTTELAEIFRIVIFTTIKASTVYNFHEIL